MHKAAGIVHEETEKLFEEAKAVGYDSDAAFSKALKRVLGVAPKGIPAKLDSGDRFALARLHSARS